MADEVYAAGLTGLEHELDCLSVVLVRDAGYEQWLASQVAVDPGVIVDGGDWCVIRHSAGTTGRPKGVGYTHDDWVRNCRNWAYILPRMSTASAVGHAGPISHASGYLFLPGWLHGAATVMFGAFDPRPGARDDGTASGQPHVRGADDAAGPHPSPGRRGLRLAGVAGDLCRRGADHRCHRPGCPPRLR
jgi:hypothetical protein